MSPVIWLALLVVGMFFTFALGFRIGWDSSKDEEQEKAVKEGRAEYYLDSNNTRQFRYKTK